MLTVKLLQTPSVSLDGKPIAFPYKRVDALLYYMLVRRSATRHELISLLWENCDEETGLKNLRNTLYTLKKVLGGELLISPQKALVMVNDGYELDCDYRRFVEQGDFSAYRGAFLQGFTVKNAFSYEEWLGRTREKLRERYLSSLADRAREAGERGDGQTAQQYALDYLDEDPLDERMSAFLMQQYRKAALYPKVALIYQRLKSGLQSELGISPMDATTALYYEIMNEWNATVGDNGNAADAAPVGREDAYTRLQMAADAFLDGPAAGSSQLLVGESGSGKRELVNAFLRTTQLPETIVLRTSCFLSESARPLTPWDAPVMSALQFAAENSGCVSSKVTDELGRVFAGLGRAGEEPDSRRREGCADAALIDALLQLFSAISLRKRLLLVFEDLQWIDVDSLRLLDALLRWAPPRRVMLLLTCRDACRRHIEQFLAAAEADGLLHRRRLGPLTQRDTARLLCRELGEETAARLAGRFYRETGGNLVLLMDLAKAYRQTGDIQAVLTGAQDILLQRLSGLSEQALEVAEHIALFPAEAPCELLLPLLENDEEKLAAGAQELCARGLVTELGEAARPSYTFIHTRLRQLLCHRQSFFRRRPLHLHIAKLLCEGGGGDRVGLCRQAAHHYAQAGEPLQGLYHEAQALDYLSSMRCDPLPVLISSPPQFPPPAALRDTLSQLQNRLYALKLKGSDATGMAERTHKLLTLVQGRLALFEGRAGEGAAALGELSERFRPGRDDALVLTACRMLITSALQRQAPDVMEHYISAGMRILELREDPAQLALFERCKGEYFCLTREYDKSTYYLLESISALKRLPDAASYRLALAGAFYDLGRIRRQLGDLPEACSYYKKALEIVEGAGDYPGALWIYVNYGRATLALGDDHRARALFSQALERAGRTGERYGLPPACAFSAYYDGLDGEYDRAAAKLGRARELAEELDSPLEQGLVYCVMAWLREKLDRERRLDNALDALLGEPLETYARQGIRLLGPISDVGEMKSLQESLRYGISKQKPYGVPELYSKNKRFMTE